MSGNSNPLVNTIRYYFNFLMVAVYLSLGLLFLFTDISYETFPEYRKELGIVLIVYGIIRTVLAIRKIKRENEQKNSR